MTRVRLATFVLFGALSIVHTWPLATAPGSLSRNDNADAVLNEWTIAWVAHQAVADPMNLWNANMFHPERRSLAFSEPLLVPAAIGAPLFWLGQSPVLVYNVLLLLGLTLTGWAGSLVVSRWTNDPAAGVLAGVIMAFNAHTLTRMPQLQAFHVEFLPLALLAVDELLTAESARRRAVSAVALASCVVLQGLTSYYTLVFTVTAVAVGVLVRPEDWLPLRVKAPRIATLAAAAGGTLAILWVVLTPYRQLGRVRPLEEVARYSASWGMYLASPARLHYPTWSAGWFSGDTALFPGFTALALGLIAVVVGVAWRDRRARMALCFGAAGVALSFGPTLPGYATLYELVPPLQGIRNAARFGYLAIVALAILSGFALAALRRRWRSPRLAAAATVGVIVLANLDAFAGPIGYVAPDRIASVHATLGDIDAVVAHMPFYPPDRLPRNAPYLLESTANWRPMLNGYSGIIPDSYVEHARGFAGFPNAASIDALRSAGVTHVIVHDRALRDWTDNETADAVRRSPDLTPIAREGDVAIYALRK